MAFGAGMTSRAAVPPAWPAAVFAVFATSMLVYGGALAWYTLARFDVVNLVRDGYLDDTFYYFQIAKNMAAGHFSTFDGGITRTNGYHPAWMLMLVPFYWLFDGQSALFAIKAFEIALVAVGALLVALAVRAASLPWVLLFALLPTIYATPGMLYGTEAAAGMLALGGFFLLSVLFMRDPIRFRWAFAAGAFVLPWVRLEYVAISLFATGALCYVSAWTRGRHHRRQTWAWPAAVPLFGAAAGILAYFTYNGLVFGGIVPVSGAVKVFWSESYSPLEDLPDTLGRLADAAGAHALLAVEFAIYLGVLLAVPAIRRRVFGRTETRLLVAVLIFALALCVETLAVHVRHAVFISPEIAAYTHWYYVPGYLVVALAVPLRCYTAIALLRLFAPAGLFGTLGVLGIVLIGVASVFDRSILAEPFRYVRSKADSTAIHHSMPVMAYLGITAINPRLPGEAVVGSWGAGIVGYFSVVPVVNLDGLANSYAYLAAHRSEGEVTAMLDDFGITHFVDGEVPARRDESVFVGHRVVVGEREVTLQMWPKRPAPSPVALPWWEDAPRPTLAEEAGSNPGDDAFALRFGRLVQVVVPNCDRELVPEAYVISWRDGAQGQATVEQTTRVWSNPYETTLGYCTTAFLLPAGAGGAVALEAASIVDHLAGKTPVVKARFDVYVEPDQLIYFRDGCDAVDVRRGFFLHLGPADWRDLPHSRVRFGNENRDFSFQALGRRTAAGGCVAAVELPGYEVASLATGQVDDDGRSLAWRATMAGARLRRSLEGRRWLPVRSTVSQDSG